MISGMFDNSALPALERLMQFTHARHKVLVNNTANLSNPYFKATDLSVKGFQASLRQAIDARKRGADPTNGALKMQDTRELKFTEHGVSATPGPTGENILFHDQNNRDLERLMARIAENTMAHNAATELARNQFQMLGTAIRERV